VAGATITLIPTSTVLLYCLIHVTYFLATMMKLQLLDWLSNNSHTISYQNDG